MDSLAELRRIQEQRYLSQRAKENATIEAEKARAGAEKRQKYLLEKYSSLFSQTLPSIKAGMIARFIRRHRNQRLTPSPTHDNLVNLFGETYPLSLAMELSDNNISPFDTQEAKNAIEAKMRTNLQLDMILSQRLTENEVIELMLTVWINSCRYSLNLEDCEIPGLDDGLLDCVNDLDELFFRFPFASQEDKDLCRVSFWFCVCIAVQILPLPRWINSDKSSLLLLSEEKLKQHLKKIHQRHQQIIEMNEQCLPEENEIVPCSGCQNQVRFRELFCRPGGSFYFCRFCAPHVGIEVQPRRRSSEDHGQMLMMDESDVQIMSDEDTRESTGIDYPSLHQRMEVEESSDSE